MENENTQEEASKDSLLDALTKPLSEHFGYTLGSFMAAYVYACTVLFM